MRRQKVLKSSLNKLLLLIALLPTLVFADTSINGFISGIVSRSDNNAFYGSNEGGLRYETGVNLTHSINDNLAFYGGILYNNRHHDPYVDYATLELSNGTTSSHYGLRIGKNRLNFGILDNGRNDPTIRPTIVLPQSIYINISNNIARSGKGWQAFYTFNSDSSSTAFEYSIAELNMPAEDIPDVQYLHYGVKLPGKFNALKPVRLFRTTHTTEKWTFNYSKTELQYSYSGVGAHELHVPIQLFGVEYRNGPWTITSETYYATSKFPSGDNKWRSAYIMGRYEINDNWTAIVGYDKFWQPADPDGIKRSAVSGNPAYQSYSKDIFGGLSYRINKSWTLKSDVHYFEGTALIPHSTNPISKNTNKYWTLFNISATYSF